jgi:hypothetical protein
MGRSGDAILNSQKLSASCRNQSAAFRKCVEDVVDENF